MSTANVPPNPLPGLRSTGRALFVGLAWAALMLVVFGLWMRDKYEGRAAVVTPIFLVAGLVAAILAVWQAFTLWFAKLPTDQQAPALAKQQRFFSYVFLLGGLGLIVMAFALGIAKKPGGSYGFQLDNFAETVGCFLFGLVALITGYVLQLPREENLSPMQFLVAKAPTLKMVMLGLAAVCVMAFIYLGFVQKIGTSWFPELAALVFMSMLSISCFFLLNTSNIDEFGVRIFVLLFGGLTGLILFFWSIGRAILWKQDIFLGGIVAWQGENAWHFWLCAYVFFISLVLMAASFNLARADIRSSVALRRLMYGYDAIVQSLLVVGILAVFNVVVYAMVPFTYDWTKGRGIYDLAPSTKTVIGNLKKDVHVIVILPQTTWTYKDTRNLMDNIESLSSHLKVEYISPDADFKQYEQLLMRFKQIIPDPRLGDKGRGILIVNGEMPKDIDHNVPYAFIPERKLTEFDRGGAMRGGGQSKMFYKGEAEILRELKFLLQDRQKRKVYVLQGDDEPNLADDRNLQHRGFDFTKGFKGVGMGLFAEKLRKDNYDVIGLTFQADLFPGKAPEANANLVHAKAEEPGKKKEIPKDCKTLLVVGPSRPLAPEAIEAIERYMAAGGKMVVFLDLLANESYTKLKDSGLEPLLRQYGVEVTDQFALSVIRFKGEDSCELLAGTGVKTEQPIARQFLSKPVYLERSARVLKAVEPPGRHKVEPILELFAYGSIEGLQPTANFKNVSMLRDPDLDMLLLFHKNRGVLAQAINEKPVAVGMAVSEANGEKPTLVVFGNAELVTNREMVPDPRLGKSAVTNYNLVTASLDWLAEREPGGAPPRETATFSIPLPDDSPMWGRMLLLPGWLMLLSIIGLGVGIWLARRR